MSADEYCLEFSRFLDFDTKSGFPKLAEPQFKDDYLAEKKKISQRQFLLLQKIRNTCIVKKCEKHGAILLTCFECVNTQNCRHDIKIVNCLQCRHKLSYYLDICFRAEDCYHCSKLSVCRHLKRKKNCELCLLDVFYKFDDPNDILSSSMQPKQQRNNAVRKYCVSCLQNTFCIHKNKRIKCKTCIFKHSKYI